MVDAFSFLQTVQGFVNQQQLGLSANKPVLIGTVDPAYAGPPALPKITFDGESVMSGKTFAYLEEVLPSARVVLVPVGTTYCIIGTIGGGSSTPTDRVTRQIFTSNGTWNMPSGAVQVFVQVIGGGGAGAGASATGVGQWSFGDGGGAGEYAEGLYDATDLTSSVAVTIGAGGTGASANTGSDGGTTSFGAFITAVGGGAGGIRTVTSTAGLSYSSNTGLRAGGSGGSGGDFRIRGGNGEKGYAGGSGTAQSRPGDGGRSHIGGFSMGNVDTAGAAGAQYGGGGAGAGNSASQSAKAGGNGASGVCIVTTYF